MNGHGHRTTGDALLRLEDALARMLAGVEALPAEGVSLDDALGRVLAEDVHARHTLPPWDDSAMDGYAVRSADVASARGDAPVVLRVAGEVAAGHTAASSVGDGTALRILTGAPMPPGADAVVRVEDTDAPTGVADLPERVAVRVAVTPGTAVRSAGSDLHEGDLVLPSGTPIAARHVAALVAAGRAEVRVHERPRVAVLATGDELVPAGTALEGARIPDSSSAGIGAQVREAGGVPVALGIAPDDRDVIRERLVAGIATADVVVVCGGVSVGAHDEVRPALDEVGRVDLWRVAVQPGKPLTFGRAGTSDGRSVLLFGLPGNPVSSFVTFELFVRPVLRQLAGHTDLIGRSRVIARLVDSASTSPGRRAFLRVVIGTSADGTPVVRLAGSQGSHVLSGLAASNGLAVVPEGVGRVEAGAEVDVIRLDETLT
ncbi:MAG: gephyrin-like molybdotransferase Glp [Candidatus Limnocylindrales bacterium]